MKDKEYDLAYLENGLEELKKYLFSDELFFPVMGSPPGRHTSFLKLTLGNLLLSMQRLSAYEVSGRFSPGEESHYQKLKRKLENLQFKWQSSWQKKADQEYPSRFTQWSHILNDLVNDLDKNAPFYHSEVRTRALLTLLSPYTEEDERYDLTPLDNILRNILIPGEFIWGEELAPGFPEEDFWFLYGGFRG